MSIIKNPLGYAPGDETYIFRRWHEPAKVIVTKVTPSGITTVETKNYAGQTVHYRFMPSGKELGSASSWHPDRIVSKAELERNLESVLLEIAKRELTLRWKKDVEALARLDPGIDRAACIEKLQSTIQNLERAP